MKQHILLIDDDKDEVLIFCAAMDNAGIPHKCTWAQGVDHAMKMLEHVTPDIIFIDLNMPVTDGLEGIRHIRKIGSMNKVPVILYSNNIEQREKAIRLGADDCLKKPDTVHELSSQLQDVLFRIRRSDKTCI